MTEPPIGSLEDILTPVERPNFVYKYASADRVAGMLKDRPHDPLDLSETSRSLAGRPMSDAAWVVNEAARLTARAKQDRINGVFLHRALERLQAGNLRGIE